jgi:hypothetical protein
MSQENAREKYIDELLTVSCSSSMSFFFLSVHASKILKRVDDDQSKKYIAEIEAA